MKPSTGYLMSATNTQVRILLPEDHPAIDDLSEGCWIKFHKSSSPQHITLTTVSAYKRRNKNSTRMEDFMLLKGRPVHPRHRPEYHDHELVFAKKTGELLSMPSFRQLQGPYQPVYRAPGVWSFAIPKE